MSALTALERRVLELVRQGGSRASWYWLEKRAPDLGFPVPNLMPILKSLQERGLLERQMVGGGMDLWSLSAGGKLALDEPAPPGPIPAEALPAFTEALRRGGRDALVALKPVFGDPARMREALLQALASDATAAVPIAACGLFLRPEDLAPLAEALQADERPEIREAMWRAWLPQRMDVPGQAPRTLAPEPLDALLRRALLDPARKVRLAAAAFAFAANRGAGVLGELMANLGAPEVELRCLAILALGGAADPVSLAALEQFAKEPAPAEAAAAARALAARPDGHRALLAIIGGPEGEVRRAALFALAEVAVGLPREALDRLAQDARPDVREAMERYRARASARA